MIWGLRILGVILFVIGDVWFLQGIRVLPGSFMTGSLRWAVTGAVVAIVGIVLLVRSGRRGGV